MRETALLKGLGLLIPTQAFKTVHGSQALEEPATYRESSDE